VKQDFDGVEMALVPTGCFMMGSSAEDIDDALQLCEDTLEESRCRRDWLEDETPKHEQCFDEPFWIDVTEVTNAQYGSEGYFSGADRPRESVTWFEARAHCESRGTRLPTEPEWEYAARGPDGLVFPWGNRIDGLLANFCDANCEKRWADRSADDGYETTAPVGSFSGGASWVGALDMSGNVSEWTSSLMLDYPYDAADGVEDDWGGDGRPWRSVRDGSWSAPGYYYLRSTYRNGVDPSTNDYDTTGFRCARSF
jgi:formylglycine-generating enzyme required for sulfatase activity